MEPYQFSSVRFSCSILRVFSSKQGRSMRGVIHWSPPGYRNTVFLHASQPPGYRNIGFSRINCPTSLRGNSPPGMLKRRANLVSRGHFIREITQKACTRSTLEAQNSSSERLLVLKGGYRRHVKNASRLDGLQVFGVDVHFIRVLT